MAKHDPDLSLLFHALADPTRRSILTRLAEGPARVTDLAGPTGLRLPTVMRHLSVLQEAGLIATSKDGRIRTCAIVAEALIRFGHGSMNSGPSGKPDSTGWTHS